MAGMSHRALFQRDGSPPRAGLWVDEDRLWGADLLRPAGFLPHSPPHSGRTHLPVTHAAAGSRHPQAHLQPGVQGPLGGTCGILLGWRAVGNIHNHPRGGIDAEECAARGGRAVRGTDTEDREAGSAWPPQLSPAVFLSPKSAHTREQPV